MNVSFLTVILLAIKTTSFASILVPTKRDELLDDCLKKLIANFLLSDVAIVYYNHTAIEFELNNTRISYEDGKLIGETSYFTNFIFVINDSNEFRKGFQRLLRSPLWNTSSSPRGNFLIINYSQYFTEIYQLLRNVYAYRVLLLNVKDFRLYTSWNRTMSCSNYKGITGFDFNMSFKIRRSALYIPWSGDENSTFLGIFEMGMYLITAKTKLNITLISRSVDELFDYFCNNDTNLTYRMLNDQVYDSFAINWLYPHYFEHYDVTSSLFTDTEVFIFKKPGKMNNFQVILTTFKLTTWICVFVGICFVAASFYVINQDERKDGIRCFMVIIAIALNTNLKYSIKNSSIKILMAFYLIFVIHVSCYFQGRLASLITNPPFKHSYKNLNELVDSNLIPMLSYRKYVELSKNPTALGQKIVKKMETYNTTHSMINFVRNHSKYYTMTFKSVYYLNGTTDLQYVNSYHTIWTELCFGFKKGHPVFKLFNKAIVTLIESGFPNKWLEDIKIRSKNEEFVNEDVVVVLTLEHVLCAFIISICGNAFSIIIFITELIVYHRK